jgi:hypothetical protein
MEMSGQLLSPLNRGLASSRVGLDDLKNRKSAGAAATTGIRTTMPPTSSP